MNFLLQKNLGVIDGSSYLYRAYYAIPLKKGKPINAIYGVLNMIYNFLLRYQPTYFVIIFDEYKTTFRHILFKNYKLNRIPMPNTLQEQIVPLKKIIKALKFFCITSSNFEGDDIIGSLVEKLKTRFKILISTSDKDLLQLVNKNVRILNSHNCIIGPYEIKKKYGISAHLIADFLALMGDRSDNIPGIPGIGEKIALKLIRNFGDINSIYNKLDTISTIQLHHANHIQKILKNNKDIAFLSYKLTSIKKNVPLNIQDHNLNIKTRNSIKMLYFYKEQYKKIYYMQ